MVRLTSTLVAAVLGLTSIVSAHPGHDVKAEAAERATALKTIRARGVKQCSTALKARGLETSSVTRRAQILQNLRKKRGLDSTAPLFRARDTTPLSTSHASDLDVDLSTDPATLFASEGICVLAEDVTQGPYYVSGELIRSNLTEDQKGVPLYLDIQLIDSNTCEPLPNVYLDFWRCNATGVYSGINAPGNGNPSDTTNINTTFLRGLQKTDSSGLAFFTTIFPGHYTGRTTHIHILSHPANETSVNANGTISGLYTSSSSHVGQIFFDQELISLVEGVEPYASNTQELTTNEDNEILAEELGSGIDPFVEYVLLGEDVRQGVFGWVGVVVDKGVSREVIPAAFWTGDGGGVLKNEGADSGPGDGFGFPSGFPGGVSSGVPSGVPSGVISA